MTKRDDITSKFFRGLDETVEKVDFRHFSSDTNGRKKTANELALSLALDLLVEAGLLTEENRSSGMQAMYRRIGAL